MKNSTIRITVDLSPQQYEQLNTLTERLHLSTKANTVRRALALYHKVTELANPDKGEFLYRTRDSKEQKLLFL